MERKRKSALTAGLLALILLVTGTFAWTSISQRALNDIELENNPGGRLHDDYDKQPVLNGASKTANKDIYAENYGESSLFVRIKLTEYLEIGGTPLTVGQKGQKDTWEPYTINDSLTLENGESMADYVTWLLGGQKDFMPTFNKDNQSLVTDVTGDAYENDGTDQVQGTAPGDGTHNYWTAGQEHTDTEYYRDADGNLIEGADTIHTAKPTLQQELDVMTMAEWQAMGKPTGNFWVIDTDGWAYWANRLPASEATSLLLNEIVFSQNISDSMYYGIHVIGEFATGNDLNDFVNGTSDYNDASKDAQELLDIVSGKVSYHMELTPTDVILNRGDTQQFTATVIETIGGTPAPVADAEITYSLEVATTRAAMTSSVDTNGLLTIANNETNETLQLTATAVSEDYDLSVSVNINVFIIPTEAGATFKDPETGLLWRVLVPDDGNGNALIITEGVYGFGTLYNTTSSYTLYESSNLRTVMDDWYNRNTNVGETTIRPIALDYKYQTADGTDIAKGDTGAGIEYNWTGAFSLDHGAKLQRALTKAGDVSTKGEGQAFALSVSEANTYFTNDASRIGKDTAGTARDWWMRSTGNSYVNRATDVGTDGRIYSAPATYRSVGFRPALWVERR